MRAFTFFRPHPAVADIVETIWDIDLPDANFTRALTIKVLPAVSPMLCVHYRPLAGSDQRLSPCPYRQRAIGVQTGAVTVRPRGAIGAVIVYLKPEAACRVMGGRMDEFTDTSIWLCDLFSPTEMSLLEEMLAEATDAAERAECVQTFLLRHMRDNESDQLVRQAALHLRRAPNLSMRWLASHLDISERHLSRRFQATFGTNPKQFARIVRIGKVIAARRRGAGWADIAYACGFNDQAHMVHDFKSMAGSTPEALFPTASDDRHGLNTSLAKSDFYNTFVFQLGMLETTH
jgi:AraC-like DNA-binding protein